MSLRARLVAALVLVTVVLIGSGVVILGLVRASLLDEVDHQLAAVASAAGSPFAEQLQQGPPPDASSSLAGSPFTQLYIARVQPDGSLQIFLRSDAPEVPSVDGAEAVERATEPADVHPFDVSSADGTVGFRVVAVRTASGATTVVALPTDRVLETYQRVRAGVIGVGTLVFVVLALAGWWVERLGIGPIKRVTDAAAAIAGGDLDHRVEPQSRRTEAGQLAEAFNVMIDRRQEADGQLRRFIADASHELRSPLATVAGVLELQQSGVLPTSELDEALRRASQETARMSGLVEDLLLLARLDQGRPLDVQRVDLAEIAADAVLDASIHEPVRVITADLVDHAYVRGDEQRLRQVATNLMENAVAHTPGDGEIVVRARVEGDVCVLEIVDTGCGMTGEDAARVFDRFFRVDSGRARATGGSGLGLSIVASIVAAHRGGVSVETAPGAGATFRVALPRGCD